ncbi:MAG: hypothetical protein QM441_01125 [Synergistota bacterium]|nr:hypothetical protein [Synergistota bacterium]
MPVWAAALLFLGFVAISAHVRYRARAQTGARLAWLFSFSILAGVTLLYLIASIYFAASIR